MLNTKQMESQVRSKVGVLQGTGGGPGRFSIMWGRGRRGSGKCVYEHRKKQGACVCLCKHREAEGRRALMDVFLCVRAEKPKEGTVNVSEEN